MARVKNGRVVKVDNTERVFGSASEYYAVWVEDADGKNERCLLFTEMELITAQNRANVNLEDLTEKTFLTDLTD
jgi:hypothetical protein